MSENAQSFEDKLKAANEILANLNKADTSLEQSVALHKQGQQLLKEAREILERAELVVKEAGDE